ncbi:MAG: glycosyltransferase family 2 protein [Phycisphaerae bacterium]|jgi:glycosyltransferase involved in cell wall biosynthesis
MSGSDAPLSVIVPCRNAQRWLGEALESILRQTVRPMEVIVVDDASTDRSAAVARSFGGRVRVIPSFRRGCNAARYTGMKAARGRYVALLDADDRIEPAKHEKQLAVLESADPWTLVHTGSTVFWDDASRPPLLRRGTETAVGRCTRVIFETNPVCGASVMLRRDTLMALGNYDPAIAMSGDYAFSLIASTRCRFVCLPEPLYAIRRHAGNSTRLLNRKAWYHWLAQEQFRVRCPAAFAELPPESIERYMRRPVLDAARSAYWRRDGRDYRRLLKLAVRLAPADPEIQRLWRRRWCPMAALRAWDRLTAGPARSCKEASA